MSTLGNEKHDTILMWRCNANGAAGNNHLGGEQAFLNALLCLRILLCDFYFCKFIHGIRSQQSAIVCQMPFKTNEPLKSKDSAADRGNMSARNVRKTDTFIQQISHYTVRK